MKRTKTHSQLKKELDAIFSRFIRLKYAVNGVCICFTCHRLIEIKKAQCGHFVPRTYLITRWEEDNCRPQCAGCNIWGRGQLLTFEENLKKELGSARVEALKKSRHTLLKIEPSWFQQKILHYGTQVGQKWTFVSVS